MEAVKSKKRRRTWTPDKKAQIVAAYLMLGNAPATAAAFTGLSPDLIRQWKMQPWWSEIVENIRMEENLTLDSRMTRILARTFDIVEDRLQNGEFQYDPKEGKLIRRPVNMKDTNKVAGDVIDRRALLRQIQGAEVKNTQAIAEQLKQIAASFAEMARKGPKNGEAEAQQVHGSVHQASVPTSGEGEGES